MAKINNIFDQLFETNKTGDFKQSLKFEKFSNQQLDS